MQRQYKLHVITMGVSGSGKSLIGHTLAEILGAHFLDGDDLHPASNIEKMATRQRSPTRTGARGSGKQHQKPFSYI